MTSFRVRACTLCLHLAALAEQVRLCVHLAEQEAAQQALLHTLAKPMTPGTCDVWLVGVCCAGCARENLGRMFWLHLSDVSRVSGEAATAGIIAPNPLEQEPTVKPAAAVIANAVVVAHAAGTCLCCITLTCVRVCECCCL